MADNERDFSEDKTVTVERDREEKKPDENRPEEKKEQKETAKAGGPEKKAGMKMNPLLIAVIALSLLVVGLLIVLLTNGKKDDKKKSDSAAVTETEVSSEGTSETASDEATSEAPKEVVTEEGADRKAGRPAEKAPDASEDIKYEISCKVASADGWEDGGRKVMQFSIIINNSSSSDQKDWEVRLPGFTDTKYVNGWNAEYEISGDTLFVTPVEYNTTIPKGSSIDMGVQISFASTADAEAAVKGLTGKKSFPIYIAGELHDAEKAPVETMDEKKKEEVKKEKPAAETGSPLENHGALSVSGTDLVDKNGKPYQLKGISTHGLAWFPEYVNKAAFQEFRDNWGANVIRLAMYTGESGGYCSGGDKDALKKLVSDGVDYATELGMYVLIDWHILSDSNPLTNEDEAILFFDEMSAKYADYDNVLFEICNEPNGGTSWEDVKSYAEDVIPVIRKNKADAVIIVGTPTWSQDVDLAAADPITEYDNLLYTIHFYAATHKDNIRNKVKEAHDKGLAMIVSEFSICDASGNGGIDYDSADEWFSLIDEYNLSYIGWNLSNKNETSSLIDSSCSKTSGWEDGDLSETGLWLKKQISGE